MYGLPSPHDQMVRGLACELNRRGFCVVADHLPEFHQRPPSISGYIPDLVAYCGSNAQIIAEAETEDGMQVQHTYDQWRAFSTCGCHFHVIVPAGCVPYAQSQAYVHGIRVDFWWQMPVT